MIAIDGSTNLPRQSDETPHVVMMVANDITNDSRVLKEATALARAGLRVTLLGVVRKGPPTVDHLDDGVLMVRLPGRFVLRDDRDRRRRERRSRRLVIGDPAATWVARTVRIDVRLSDLKAESGHAAVQRKSGRIGALGYKFGVARRVLRRRRWQVAGRVIAFRSAIAQRRVQTAGRFWRRWDEKLGTVARPVRWRTVIPEAHDYEAIFGDFLDKIRPDAIHAHDMHVIGVAARAAGRAALRGHNLKIVYDAHEYVAGLSQYPPRTGRLIAAWARHEAEYIRSFDLVITVSPAIARTLYREHRLERAPSVVMNSPSISQDGTRIDGIRERIGLPSGTPLLVYSGGVTRARGVETAIEALRHLPDVHLAVVCVPTVDMKPVRELKALADRLAVSERVHYLNPVSPDEVVPFLSSADIGLIPLLRFPSHEMALPNKVFEYIFAGLPVVTSDMPSLQEFVERTNIGAVFKVEDPVDLAAAVRRVLARRNWYRANATQADLHREVSWERQASRLSALYADLLGCELGTTLSAPDDQLEKKIRKLLHL